MKQMIARIVSFVPHSEPTSVAAAEKTQDILFIFFVGTLILSAILTILLYRAGNAVTKAIKRDADARIAEARAKSSDADAKAEAARADAAVANEEAAKANAEAARLTAEAETTKQRTTELEIRLAEARKELAKAQRALLELQQRVSRRLLNENQRTFIVQVLTGENLDAIQLQSLLNDQETSVVARQLEDVLREAGWRGAMECRLISEVVGLKLTVHSQEAAPPITRKLLETLSMAGFGMVQVGASDGVPPGKVVVTVGSDPAMRRSGR